MPPELKITISVNVISLATIQKYISTYAGVTGRNFPLSQFFPRGKNGPAHSFLGEKLTGEKLTITPGFR